MTLSGLRKLRFRTDVLRRFVIEDLPRAAGENITTIEAWSTMIALAAAVDRVVLANVPRHSVLIDGLRIAIEGDEIVNITRHNDAHVYAEPTLEVLK